MKKSVKRQNAAFGKDNLYRLLNNNGMSMLISTGVTVGSLAALTASAPGYRNRNRRGCRLCRMEFCQCLGFSGN